MSKNDKKKDIKQLYHQEFLEGEDPEQGIEELNRNSNKQIYKTSAINNSNALSKNKKIDIDSKYENIIKKYEEHFEPIKKENYNEEYDAKFSKDKLNENPLVTFNKLQEEVELIEKDLNYYSKNKDSYKSVVPIETSLEELNKLKYIIKYINSSSNFEKLKKINETQKKNNIAINEVNYNLLNKKLYNKLEEQLEKRLNNIKKLKKENPMNYQNIEYELFLTLDNEKMKQLKELDELVLKINDIEKKIGKWNLNNKKNTIASALDTIKSNMILLDKTAKVDMKKKFDGAKNKIEDIKNNYKEEYEKIDHEKLKDITSGGIDAKNIEKIICNVIYKMELLKDDHEKSLYLSQKVKELINRNEETQKQIYKNTKILDGLQESVDLNVDVMSKNIEIIKQKLK
jgi:hypothetical protein